MDKFLEKLESRVTILEETTRKNVIKRYQSDIEKNIKKGMTENEAIEALGTLDDVVKEIYEEYHLNSNYRKKGRLFSQVIRDGVNSAAKLMSTFCVELASRVKTYSNGKGLELFFEIMLKILLLVMAIMVLRLPFLLIEAIFNPVFNLLFFPFNVALDWILMFILSIIYIACCIALGIAMFKGYWNANITVESKEAEEKIEHSVVEEKVVGPDTTHYLFVIIKAILFAIIIIPLIGINIVLLFFTFVASFLVYKGVTILGLAIILLGLFLLSTVITSYVTDALDRREKTYKIRLVISILAIIIGVIFFVDNITTFNYSSNIEESNFSRAVRTKSVTVDEHLIIFADRDFDFVIDNNIVDNELLLVFTYNDRIIDVRVLQDEIDELNFLFIYTVRNDLRIDTWMYIYDNTLLDLQDSNIFNYRYLRKYELTIYVNEKTRELIR